MKYGVTASISFTVDADSRAEAHAEAANRLIEADLSGFDLGRLIVSGPIRPTDYAANGAPDIRLQDAARPVRAGTEIGSFVADKDGWYDVGTKPPRYLGPDRPQMSTDFPGQPFGRGDTITVVPPTD